MGGKGGGLRTLGVEVDERRANITKKNKRR